MDAGARKAFDRLWAEARAATPLCEPRTDEEWGAEIAAWSEMDAEGLRLWLLAMNEAALDVERERNRVLNTAVALTDNDRCILIGMLNMGATGINPQNASQIVGVALYRGDPKLAFRRLIAAGMVRSRRGRGGGYWLTDFGIRVARLARNE